MTQAQMHPAARSWRPAGAQRRQARRALASGPVPGPPRAPCGVGKGCLFFENSSVDVGMMSLLSSPTAVTAPRRVGLAQIIPLSPPFSPHPPPSPSVGVLSPSLSLSPSVLSCHLHASLVVPGDVTASVRVFSGGACSQAGMCTFRFQSVQARATEHALRHVHVHSAQWFSAEFQ